MFTTDRLQLPSEALRGGGGGVMVLGGCHTMHSSCNVNHDKMLQVQEISLPLNSEERTSYIYKCIYNFLTKPPIINIS